MSAWFGRVPAAKVAGLLRHVPRDIRWVRFGPVVLIWYAKGTEL